MQLNTDRHHCARYALLPRLMSSQIIARDFHYYFYYNKKLSISFVKCWPNHSLQFPSVSNSPKPMTVDNTTASHLTQRRDVCTKYNIILHNDNNIMVLW